MARASAIACGYADAIELDRLRHDPLMKVAVGRCPETGAPLASQSTISRLENAPSKTEAGRLSAALLDQFGTTVKPGKLEVLDIDDTFCTAHGGQQLALWNAQHDERGFASMHIYHVASGRPVAAILRPARTPKGSEVRTVIKHVTKRLRRHWPKTRLVWRGDSLSLLKIMSANSNDAVLREPAQQRSLPVAGLIDRAEHPDAKPARPAGGGALQRIDGRAQSKRQLQSGTGTAESARAVAHRHRNGARDTRPDSGFSLSPARECLLRRRGPHKSDSRLY